jgi:DNA uptake protein ComE-like DNA-binding protein
MAVLLMGALLAACAPAAGTPVTTDGNTSTVEFTGQKLNLNTVTGDELLAVIPDFGNRMVREFQEYRPYLSIRQFRQEIGKYVSDAQVAEYEIYVYVPISFNESDSETLQQIPGVDATEAESLIAGRPYASKDAFLAKLGEYVSPSEVEIGVSYLDGGS